MKPQHIQPFPQIPLPMGLAKALGSKLWPAYRGQAIYVILDAKALALLTGLTALLVFANFVGNSPVLPMVPATETPTVFEPAAKAVLTAAEGADGFREAFSIEKNRLVSGALIKARVSRPAQLPEKTMLELHGEISSLFVGIVLARLPLEEHVYRFFADTADLHKIKTSLTEQAKFHVPASIKLAQAALETGYGRHVPHNNYFGIKAKNGNGKPGLTLEYFTAEELEKNAKIVMDSQKTSMNGKTVYKCQVKDGFSAFGTPWESFRAHSLHLQNNTRYAPLFAKGKDYRAWAARIGAVSQGGLGYATDPNYGNALVRVIERCHLDLLDF